MRLVLPEPVSPNPEFARPSSPKRLDRAMHSLNARGFPSEIVDSREEARRQVLDAVPEGAEVHSALSETMRELGITTEIDESGRYHSVRKRLMQFDRPTQFREMQKMAAAPDYIVGSANAVTEDGDILVGSGSGSQIGAYAYAAAHVILVVGHQKIVRDVAEGMRRMREYCVPLEFERMKSIGHQGTVLAKTLILHSEFQGRVRVILIRDAIGF
jgi:L-lactate utilization protein LutC